MRRGQGVVGTLYNDRDERRRLYQYGFTPYVGRRFERISPQIRSVLKGSQGYGLANQKQQLEVFKRLGLLISKDPWFGFRARASVTDQGLHENWEPLLAWWMSLPGAKGPSAQDLRSWQRFVSENLEFRLGVAIGAVVAQAWTEGADDPASVPSLEAWRQTTGLPWFGFWAREMLRWGTLDPFVAFALAQGLAGTRGEAKLLRESFESWMDLNYVDILPEDWIDPQYFLEWQRTLHEDTETSSSLQRIKTRLTGTDGCRGEYRVLPLMSRSEVRWLDASGFELARSKTIVEMGEISYRDDFELRISQGKSFVHRIFRSSQRTNI